MDKIYNIPFAKKEFSIQAYIDENLVNQDNEPFIFTKKNGTNNTATT